MIRLRCFQLAIACLAFLLSGVLRGEDAKKATPEEIERLVKQLGSDDCEKREAASKALEAIGKPALDNSSKCGSDTGVGDRSVQLYEASHVAWR